MFKYKQLNEDLSAQNNLFSIGLESGTMTGECICDLMFVVEVVQILDL
jgi:hypothetical protein